HDQIVPASLSRLSPDVRGDQLQYLLDVMTRRSRFQANARSNIGRHVCAGEAEIIIRAVSGRSRDVHDCAGNVGFLAELEDKAERKLVIVPSKIWQENM